MSELDEIGEAMDSVYSSTEFLVARPDDCYHTNLWLAADNYLYKKLKAALTSEGDISEELELARRINRRMRQR